MQKMKQSADATRPLLLVNHQMSAAHSLWPVAACRQTAVCCYPAGAACYGSMQKCASSLTTCLCSHDMQACASLHIVLVLVHA